MNTLEAFIMPSAMLVAWGGYERIGPCLRLSLKPFHNLTIDHTDSILFPFTGSSVPSPSYPVKHKSDSILLFPDSW